MKDIRLGRWRWLINQCHGPNLISLMYANTTVSIWRALIQGTGFWNGIPVTSVLSNNGVTLYWIVCWIKFRNTNRLIELYSMNMICLKAKWRHTTSKRSKGAIRERGILTCDSSCHMSSKADSLLMMLVVDWPFLWVCVIFDGCSDYWGFQ